MKKKYYILLLAQIFILLLSPRFGWCIHNFDAALLTYQGTSYKNGSLHCTYGSETDIINIQYDNIFSKKFAVTVNDIEYTMEVKLDGSSSESETHKPPYIKNDLVWNDTYGVFYWRCILTIVMTLISMKAFQRASSLSGRNSKALYVCVLVLYIISLLISLRILF